MKIKLNCKTCGQLVERSKSQIRSTNVYCNRKCSLINANKEKYKDHIKQTRSCSSCSCDIDIRSKTNLCLECHTVIVRDKNKSQTLGELKTKHKNGKFFHWYSSEVRNYNREWNKDLLNLPCQVCGYSRKIHLAHIKPVASFPDTATLGEINDINNNLVLCPNHHSEFDDGYISLSDIPKRS